MARPITLNYPCHGATAEPRPLSAQRIWEVAADLRRQVVGGSLGPASLDVPRIIDRTRRLAINGIKVETHWECDRPVHDHEGEPVIGACEYDPAVPGAAMLYTNAEQIAGRGYLERSTAAHELGHAVFDVPAWIVKHRQTELDLGLGAASSERIYRIVTPDEEHLRNSRTASGPMDWREFRANELMGALLVPEPLLRRQLMRRAVQARLPLVSREGQAALPGVPRGAPALDARRVQPLLLDALICDLAEEFGVSPSFIRVRLSKYGLAKGL